MLSPRCSEKASEAVSKGKCPVVAMLVLEGVTYELQRRLPHVGVGGVSMPHTSDKRMPRLANPFNVRPLDGPVSLLLLARVARAISW
jgi:hypothetical protein